MQDERLSPEEYLQRLEAEISRDARAEEPEELPQETTEKEPVKKKKKKKRRKKRYLLRFLIVVALIAGAVYALQSELFYVREIEVEGNRFYTPAQVIEMSGIETGKNMFFEIKTRPARDNLLQSPYIRIAEIHRKPMSKISITVEERPEYAALPDGDAYVLIDNEGMVLSISDKQPVLPLLEGMNVIDMEPGKPLKVEQAYLLSDTLELLQAVDDTDLYFARIFFTPVSVRAYINDTYYCEGEPSQILAGLPNIKAAVREHLNNGISRGVIKVGTDGYLAFDPKID